MHFKYSILSTLWPVFLTVSKDSCQYVSAEQKLLSAEFTGDFNQNTQQTYRTRVVVSQVC